MNRRRNSKISIIRFRTQAANTSTTMNYTNTAYYPLTYNMATATQTRVIANDVIVVCIFSDDEENRSNCTVCTRAQFIGLVGSIK